VDPNELLQRGVLYTLPGMDDVAVLNDVVYKTAGEALLHLDVYRPSNLRPDKPCPAVIFIHGDGPPEMLRNSKDWGVFIGWGRLAAVSGFVGVTFNHRSTDGLTRLSDVAGDIDDLLGYIRAHAGELGLDPERICIWTCSAGGPFGLRAALRNPAPYVRCVVSYYAIMDLQQFRSQVPPEVSDETLREFSPVRYLSTDRARIAPLFVARAGRDRPELNESIAGFVREALANNITLDFMNHPNGQHAFDMLDDDARTREIIQRTLEFMQTHLATT
jgi:acetyl esterase/lipase